MFGDPNQPKKVFVAFFPKLSEFFVMTSRAKSAASVTWISPLWLGIQVLGNFRGYLIFIGQKFEYTFANFYDIG